LASLIPDESYNAQLTLLPLRGSPLPFFLLLRVSLSSGDALFPSPSGRSFQFLPIPSNASLPPFCFFFFLSPNMGLIGSYYRPAFSGRGIFSIPLNFAQSPTQQQNFLFLLPSIVLYFSPFSPGFPKPLLLRVNRKSVSVLPVSHEALFPESIGPVVCWIFPF